MKNLSIFTHLPFQLDAVEIGGEYSGRDHHDHDDLNDENQLAGNIGVLLHDLSADLQIGKKQAGQEHTNRTVRGQKRDDQAVAAHIGSKIVKE